MSDAAASTGGWECKSGDSKAQICRNKHLGAVFTNPRIGEWAGLPKWEHQGAGGWACKTGNSKAQIWVMAGPAKTGTSGCRWVGLQKREQ